MKRITPEIKAIADAHINAKRINQFDDVPVTSPEELLDRLREGKTFSNLLHYIETKYVSVTSLILAGAFNHETDAYKKPSMPDPNLSFQPMQQTSPIYNITV